MVISILNLKRGFQILIYSKKMESLLEKSSKSLGAKVVIKLGNEKKTLAPFSKKKSRTL